MSIDTMEPIQNKVAASPIKVVNLEEIIGDLDIVEFDIADYLDKGFILREKDFRSAMKDYDWSQLAGKHVGIVCSSDAIIPTWVYMLIAANARDEAASVRVTDAAGVRNAVVSDILSDTDWSQYEDLMIVLKGCGSRTVPPTAYAEATMHLQGIAKKIMYGEPCSSVHVWRR